MYIGNYYDKHLHMSWDTVYIYVTWSYNYLSTKHTNLYDQFQFHQLRWPHVQNIHKLYSCHQPDVVRVLIVYDVEGFFFCNMRCKENDWGTVVYFEHHTDVTVIYILCTRLYEWIQSLVSGDKILNLLRIVYGTALFT